MKSVCVYLGSRNGSDPQWQTAARIIGHGIGTRGWRLVYGGARAGLMGICANAALEAGAEVIGVIPQHLIDREVAHTGLTELIKVSDMHTRKARMAALADGFVALPGGIGTLEEFFETWTWQYLGLHDKPIGLLNQADFFTPLLAFLDNAVEAGFLNVETRARLIAASDPEALLNALW